MKTENYPNMITYAKTEFATFDEKPFGEVDSMILCWLSYIYFHDEQQLDFSQIGLPVREIYKAEYFEKMVDGVWNPEEMLELLSAVVASPRFRYMHLLFYRHALDPETNTQFSAVVFRLRPKLFFVAYRGTDWSLTGWKEDFHLALENPIPSQKLAVDYLQTVASMLEGQFIVGGHSKGGNLAVYAAACCDEAVQQRILAVYSHDGPGFLATDLDHPGFARIRSRIQKTIPQSSIFGMMFESEAEYKVISSNGISVGQHNLLTWRVEDGHLVEREDRSGHTKSLMNKLNHWISKLSQDEREVIIFTVFDILDTTGAETIDELGSNVMKNLPVILRSIKALDKEQQRFMLNVIRLLIFGGHEDFDQMAGDLKEKLKDDMNEEQFEMLTNSEILPEDSAYWWL